MSPSAPIFVPVPYSFYIFLIKYKLSARVIFPSFQDILYLFILYCVYFDPPIFNPVYDTTKNRLLMTFLSGLSGHSTNTGWPKKNAPKSNRCNSAIFCAVVLQLSQGMAMSSKFMYIKDFQLRWLVTGTITQSKMRFNLSELFLKNAEIMYEHMYMLNCKT